MFIVISYLIKLCSRDCVNQLLCFNTFIRCQQEHPLYKKCHFRYLLKVSLDCLVGLFVLLFVYSFIYLFIHSFIGSFFRSSIIAFVRLFVDWFLCSVVHLLLSPPSERSEWRR